MFLFLRRRLPLPTVATVPRRRFLRARRSPSRSLLLIGGSVPVSVAVARWLKRRMVVTRRTVASGESPTVVRCVESDVLPPRRRIWPLTDGADDRRMACGTTSETTASVGRAVDAAISVVVRGWRKDPERTRGAPAALLVTLLRRRMGLCIEPARCLPIAGAIAGDGWRETSDTRRRKTG